MKNPVTYIFILFILIIAGTLLYRNYIQKPVYEEKITLNEEFEISTTEIFSIKGKEKSSFKIAKIGASLSGYYIDYELNIDNKKFNKDNINESDYLVKIISSDYKTKAKFIIETKKD
jgi:hypothetical protein